MAVLLSISQENEVIMENSLCVKHNLTVGDMINIRTWDNLEWGILIEGNGVNLSFGAGWSFIQYQYLLQRCVAIMLEQYGDKQYNMYQFDTSMMLTEYPASYLECPKGFITPISDRIMLQSLTLPAHLNDICEHNFKNPIEIMGENGFVWEVEWTKLNGFIHLNKGWEEIVKSMSIELCDVLFFKYHAQNSFEVKICSYRDGEVIISGFNNFRINNLTLSNGSHQKKLWTTKLTGSSCTGRQPLTIPVHVAKQLFVDKPTKINIMLPNGDVEEWSLLYKMKRRYECRLGKGWYKFGHQNNLKDMDEVEFYKTGRSDTIRIAIKRATTDNFREVHGC